MSQAPATSLTPCPYCWHEVPAQCLICPFCDEPLRDTRGGSTATTRPDQRPPRWVPSRPLAILGGFSLLVPLALAALAGEYGILLGVGVLFGVLAPFLLLLVYLERDRKPPALGRSWFLLAPLETVGAFAVAMLAATLAALCVGLLVLVVCVVVAR